MTHIGASARSKEAPRHVSGRGRYVDDLVFPGMLHARTIRSTIPAGRIRAVRHALDARAGFTVVDYRDIPGRNVISLIEQDQPCLAEEIVRHVAEPILLLAHADRERLHLAEPLVHGLEAIAHLLERGAEPLPASCWSVSR